MENYLRMWTQVSMRMREYLVDNLGFIEVHTATQFLSISGVVPTRKPDHFYSLVQSPQEFKQMLIAGAVKKCFQIARCYSDDLTIQPEFTQLGIELSSATRDEILKLIEELLLFSWPREYPKITIPFKRMTYKEALEKYGTDKPDMRFGFLLNNVTDIVSKDVVFKRKYSNLGAYCIIVRAQEAFWNDNASKRYKSLGTEFEGTLFVRKFAQYEDMLDCLTEHFTTDVALSLIVKLILEEHDLLFLAIGEKQDVLSLMGRIRIDYHDFLIEHEKTEKCHENHFLWVIDYPMFGKNSVTGEFESMHHPFTAPHSDDMERFNNMKSDELELVRSQAYDLVLNGEEIGVGSIRIHDRFMQNFVLKNILKIPPQHLDHLLNGFEYGSPPHGGIALVIDRLLEIICRASSIADVIAFPKSLNVRSQLSNVPKSIPEVVKKLNNITIVEEGHAETSMAHPQKDDDADSVEVGTENANETVTEIITEDVPTIPKTPENDICNYNDFLYPDLCI